MIRHPGESRDPFARIDPSNETTPTLGRERSFFEEIFGNIGATAPGQRGQTQDNPQ